MFCCVDLGLEIVFVECYLILGGVCLNVGCILLKVLLYVFKVIEEVKYVIKNGIYFGELIINLDEVCVGKDVVVVKLIGGLVGMVKVCKVIVVEGLVVFIDLNILVVCDCDGNLIIVKFDNVIIVVGFCLI